MAGGATQASRPLLLAIILIIGLSGGVKAQGKRREHAECVKARLTPADTSTDRCNGIVVGDSVALVAINQGAITVALKLDKDGKRKMKTVDDAEELEEQMDDADDDDSEEVGSDADPAKRRRKRQTPDDDDKPEGGMTGAKGKPKGKGMGSGEGMTPGQRRAPRMERLDERKQGKMQGPKCVTVPLEKLKRLRKGAKLSKAMTFKVLDIQLLNSEKEELDFDIKNLRALRKRKGSTSSCKLDRSTVQDDNDVDVPVDMAALEYKIERPKVNVSVGLSLLLTRIRMTLDGEQIPARTLKTIFRLVINKCEVSPICDEIAYIKLVFLINVGAAPVGQTECKGRFGCFYRYSGGGGVQMSTEYMSDNQTMELDPDALSSDGKNIFTIRIPAQIIAGKALRIKYDPIVAATEDESTDDDVGDIVFGDYSSAARQAFYYPLVFLTAIVNLFVRLP